MKKKVISLLGMLVLNPILMIGSSLAWFAETVEIEIENLEGDIFTGYFYGGEGTETKPFTITRPVHYYNMVSLIEYSDEFAGKYYQIGDDIDGDGDIEVFAYDDDGHPIYTADNKATYSTSLNMNATPIDPVGNEVHPFTGSLNGSNLTISNIQVSAEGFSDVGIFGYVGEEASVKNLYFNGVTIDTNGLVASNDDASENHTAHADNTAHCGFLAGHIEKAESFENVYVNDCQLAGENTTANLKIANDWGYYGHCENAKGLADFVKRVRGDTPGFGGSIGMDNVYNRLATFSSYTDASVYTHASVQSGEFHYYSNNVEDLSKATTSTTEFNTYEYFDDANPLRGRLTYNSAKTYLWGKRTHEVDYTITKEYHTDSDRVCYYIASGNYYLSFSGGNAGRTQTASDKTLFFTDSDGWIYYEYNDSKYYPYANSNANGTLRSSKDKHDYMFRIDGTTFRLYQNNAQLTQCSRYVRYRSSSFQVYTSSTSFTQTTDYRTETTVDHKVKYESHGSYIPLNVYNSAEEINDEEKARITEQGLNVDPSDLVVNGAKLNNTGYIIGGTKGTGDWDSGVRIANTYDYGDLCRALGNGTDPDGRNTSKTFNNANLQILTRTKDSDGIVYILDTYNANTALTDDQKKLTGTGYQARGLSYIKDNTRVDYTNLGLKMYQKARDGLKTMCEANTNTLYVMRFNEFNIDIDNTITAEKVLLNGNIKENYEFPESCVDFNLAEKGYINFFGGGFRGGTCDAFFSLYHVIRNSNDKMTSLKRLSKIYGTDNKKDPYIYEYVDGNYSIYNTKTKTYDSTSLLAGYTEHFNMKWVEEPGFEAVDNTCWYFEIPVNEGEYALGSAINTKTSTGGYMFYLDVGSNGDIEEADKTDDFGPVEYRDANDVVEDTILLITYVQPNNSELDLTVNYEESTKTYTITMTCDVLMQVKVTLLSEEHKYIFNSSDAVQQIGTSTYSLS